MKERRQHWRVVRYHHLVRKTERLWSKLGNDHQERELFLIWPANGVWPPMSEDVDREWEEWQNAKKPPSAS